jgi:hypothetical protein
MNVSKMIVVGIGMLAFLLSPLQLTAQAQSEGSGQSRDKQQISEKAQRGAHPNSPHRGGRGRIEGDGRGHGKIDYHRSGHGYYRHGGSHGYYAGHRHYAPSRHWRYYRHAGGGYAFDGRRWYFHHDGRWYYHIHPTWYGGCGGALILEPWFPWTFSFAFPGYYDCP